MKIAIVAALIISSGVSFADEAPVNYCHIQSMWDEMDQLVADTPEDPVVGRLYALRKGICNMIDAGQITLETGTDVFEIEKAKGLIERYEDDNKRRSDYGA